MDTLQRLSRIALEEAFAEAFRLQVVPQDAFRSNTSGPLKRLVSIIERSEEDVDLDDVLFALRYLQDFALELLTRPNARVFEPASGALARLRVANLYRVASDRIYSIIVHPDYEPPRPRR